MRRKKIVELISHKASWSLWSGDVCGDHALSCLSCRGSLLDILRLQNEPAQSLLLLCFFVCLHLILITSPLSLFSMFILVASYFFIHSDITVLLGFFM